MGQPRQQGEGYVVPSYRAPDDTAWYHFLHGNVPGHQIDFIYRAEVPQGALSRQHFSHLSRLMKYIEPQTNGRFAFAIGNLSRDDTQYEPGHGGLALIFGLRIQGVTDHAGRQDPPFAHGIAAIDRALDASALLASANAFHRHVLDAADAESLYRAYVRGAAEGPARLLGILEGYVDRFGDLPRPAASDLSAAWTTAGTPQPRRIVIAHDDGVPFTVLAPVATQIAAILYRSDIRWTVISNGREDDVPNGVTIRFLPRSVLTASDAAGPLHELSDLPPDEASLARALFGAMPIEMGEKPALGGWRARYSAAEAPAVEGLAKRPSWEGQAPARRRRWDPATSEEVSVDHEHADEDGLATLAVPSRDPGALLTSPVGASQARMLRPLSEPAPGDRVANVDLVIPSAPRLPNVRPSLPTPTSLVDRASAPGSSLPAPASPRSARVAWLLGAGVCALAMSLAAYVLGRSEGNGVSLGQARSSVPVVSGVAPRPSPSPPALPIDASASPIPMPSAELSASEPPSSSLPVATASSVAAPLLTASVPAGVRAGAPVRRSGSVPKSSPSASIFDGPLQPAHP
jgi:hypothetical protein